MSDGRECGWMGCHHPRCERACDAVSLAEWTQWKDALRETDTKGRASDSG